MDSIDKMIRESPDNIYEELETNFHSIEQFDELVRASALYYQAYGSVNILKMFLPNGNKKYPCLHRWTPQLAKEGVLAVASKFCNLWFVDSYQIEETEDGVFIAMTTKNASCLSKYKYLYKSCQIVEKGRENGINLTADEWLKDFPYELHQAWYNRKAIAKKIFAHLDQGENKLFSDALYDGTKNWKEEQHGFLDNWNPKGDFIILKKWVHASSEEEIQKELENFRNNFN